MPRLVLNQVQYLGLLDSIMIRKAGYPTRLTYHQFYQRYGCLDPNFSGQFSELSLNTD